MTQMIAPNLTGTTPVDLAHLDKTREGLIIIYPTAVNVLFRKQFINLQCTIHEFKYIQVGRFVQGALTNLHKVQLSQNTLKWGKIESRLD